MSKAKFSGVFSTCLLFLVGSWGGAVAQVEPPAVEWLRTFELADANSYCAFVEQTSDPSKYQQRFRELRSATGCYVHDPLPDLTGYPADVRRSFRFLTDVHPTPAGHEAIARSLAGAGVVEAQFRWIPSLGQMIMGFILPFALAFVAIPLESFIHSLRTLLGVLAVAVIHAIAFVARLIGGLAREGSKILISLYDLFIMLPLGIETLISRHRPAKSVRDSGHYVEEKL